MVWDVEVLNVIFVWIYVALGTIETRERILTKFVYTKLFLLVGRHQNAWSLHFVLSMQLKVSFVNLCCCCIICTGISKDLRGFLKMAL